MPRFRRTDPPRFYLSFRSPYSWLAFRDVVSTPELADRLRWIPFWEPDEWSERLLTQAGGRFVYTPMSREKHLYVLQDVRRLAAERGLSVSWPVDRDPCWEVPHLAYILATEQGRGRDFADAVYRARWQDGRDVCDRTTIGELAGGLGLDPEAYAAAADDQRLRAEGRTALLAIHADGVFGVPFFVHGYEKFWGLERLSAFRASVDPAHVDEPAWRPGPELAAAASDSASDSARSSDGGHAGGCG